MKLNDDLIKFFIKHNMYEERMFKYLSKHSLMIDYDDPDQRPFVGCFYITNSKDILQKINLNMPYINNNKTMLISIHEMTHGIEAYPSIGKKNIKDITCEVLPLLYEKLYILENPTKELITYSEYLDSKIDENEEEYSFALKIRNTLLENYNYNMTDMKKLTKRLQKEYHKTSKG